MFFNGYYFFIVKRRLIEQFLASPTILYIYPKIVIALLQTALV